MREDSALFTPPLCSRCLVELLVRVDSQYMFDKERNAKCQLLVVNVQHCMTVEDPGSEVSFIRCIQNRHRV